MNRKIIFLDRDGVINREMDNYVTRPDDFILNEGVREALKDWNAKGYRLIVVTNQGGISKGLLTHTRLHSIHDKMIHELKKSGISLDEIYYCPHFPSTTLCLCRKPGSLMVEKALARFETKPEDAVFIGDRERDVQAAQGAGVRGILIKSNDRLDQLQPF